MGFNALKRSALYKPLFLNYCHHMPRSQLLGIIGSVQQEAGALDGLLQEVYSFFVIFSRITVCLCDIADLLDKIAYAACGN